MDIPTEMICRRIINQIIHTISNPDYLNSLNSLSRQSIPLTFNHLHINGMNDLSRHNLNPIDIIPLTLSQRHQFISRLIDRYLLILLRLSRGTDLYENINQYITIFYDFKDALESLLQQPRFMDIPINLRIYSILETRWNNRATNQRTIVREWREIDEEIRIIQTRERITNFNNPDIREIIHMRWNHYDNLIQEMRFIQNRRRAMILQNERHYINPTYI